MRYGPSIRHFRDDAAQRLCLCSLPVVPSEATSMSVLLLSVMQAGTELVARAASRHEGTNHDIVPGPWLDDGRGSASAVGVPGRRAGWPQ